VRLNFQEIDARALELTCPVDTCQAGPGELCTGPKRSRTYGGQAPHVQRRELALTSEERREIERMRQLVFSG
jgi:hypothetical protein